MSTYTLLFVAGARPNFMKVAPLLLALRATPRFKPVLVHTGQHYDERLSECFFRDLGLPRPHHQLGVGSGTHASQTAEVMLRFEPVISLERPDAVVVVGDVNSTVAAALVAVKLGIPTFHVEAGLRSFDRKMPEEINRVVTDAVSDLLLVTEASAKRNLLAEGIAANRIHFVGNLMIDSMLQHIEAARTSDILRRLGVERGSYGVLTLHRASNVDAHEQLEDILDAMKEIARDLPLIFSVHPRTQAHLRQLSARTDAIRMIEPLGYLDFLCLLAHSAVVLTDSGGIQEETTALGIPCFTLRNNTERPVTIEYGTNVLAGATCATILAAWRQHRTRSGTRRIPPLWDGHAAERCVRVFLDYFRQPRVRSRESSRSLHALMAYR